MTISFESMTAAHIAGAVEPASSASGLIPPE